MTNSIFYRRQCGLTCLVHNMSVTLCCDIAAVSSYQFAWMDTVDLLLDKHGRTAAPISACIRESSMKYLSLLCSVGVVTPTAHLSKCMHACIHTMSSDQAHAGQLRAWMNHHDSSNRRLGMRARSSLPPWSLLAKKRHTYMHGDSEYHLHLPRL
jgi:hypothetical protein